MLPNTYELDIGCIASELVIDRKHIDFNVELKLYQVRNIEIKNIPGDLLQTIPIAFKNCKILNCEFAYTDSCACLFFENCSFACEVNIHYSLMDFIKFLNCIFYKQFTICSIVEQKVDFSNSHFKDYVDFRACEFKKNASFYGTTFDKTPNFSQVIFKDSVNLVNIKANFDFENLNTAIKNIDKSTDETANDFRDFFRTFKSVLIKDNNLLEASSFHKYELYCKELELKNKKGKTFKDAIDKYQLFFYRKLCDHHTDILQSLNSLILAIGIFGALNLVIIIGFNRYLGYKPILEHLYFSLDFYNFHIKPLIENNHLFIILVNFLILFLYLILVGFALCEKYIRKFFITISYAITFFIMITSPKILIPAMGIFTDKRVMLDPLSVLGGIYTIVFGFVVYSFVKTIRKNSIVPS
ncbi:pentapeptide repeat-containing protein [Campylobacter lari]|nr:pentapeptide repeat-containing protein [Campylobacter lari]